MSETSNVSNAFQVFMKEAPTHQAAWLEMTGKLGNASALDGKTAELVYLAVLAAARMEGGIPFHVKHARQLGASREEIISAVLAGLPAVGQVVLQCLPLALDAYDHE